MNKRTHCLLYNPLVDVTLLRATSDVDDILAQANNRSNQNQLAKVVRLNWMVENLKHEPVYKPLLVNSTMTVQTGDTRLAAIVLNDHIAHVPCLMSATIDEMNLDWVYIQDTDHLGEILNLDPNKIITQERDWNFEQLEWIEFAYDHTANHMHDERERLRMITNYLEQHPGTVFTREWLQTPIDWKQFK
jgi:hypothetical protein